MKRFLLKILLFLFSLLLLCLVYLNSYTLLKHGPNVSRGQYYSHLFYIPKQANFDVLITGSSRAAVFESCDDFAVVEARLGKSTFNFSNTGGGILNQQNYLNYFYSRKNKADLIFYFIDPFVLQTTQFDEFDMYDKEPFNFEFAIQSLNNGINFGIIKSYFTSKISFANYSNRLDCGFKDSALTRIDSIAVRKRINYLYPIQPDSLVYQSQCQKLEQTVQLALNNHAELLFIIPPTLLGVEPGHDKLILFLTDMENKYGTRFFDYSAAMSNPHYYFNHDHLNARGINYFLKNYLVASIGSHE